MRKSFHVVLMLVMLLLSFSSASATPIVNGDFSQDLFGWTVDYNYGSNYGGVDPPDDADFYNPTHVDAAGSAVLSTQGIDSGIFMSSLYQDLNSLPAGSIWFSLVMTQIADTSSPEDIDIEDFLTVSFVSGGATVSAGYNKFSFLNSSSSETGDAITYYNPPAFSFDVTGGPGTLYFDLQNEDDGNITSFLIDDVLFVPSLTPVPEPSTFMLLALAFGGVGARAWAGRRSQKRA